MGSLWNRKKDCVYLAFFTLHIPVMFLVDFGSLYPEAVKPKSITDLRTWYINTYSDRYFIDPPAWFTCYTYLELIYHLPLSVWAVRALLNGDNPKLPLHLLVFAILCSLTTLTCIVDFLSWDSFTTTQKISLGQLYVPYLVFAVFLGIDMFQRIDKILGTKTPSMVPKKKL